MRCKHLDSSVKENGMFTVHHLTKSYNLQLLFERVTFSLNPGERVGLIGPNGCGKTTLLRILTGEEEPDDGHISRDPTLRIGYLPQKFEPDPCQTLEEVIGRAVGSVESLEAELSSTALELTRFPADANLQQRYDDLLLRIEKSETGRSARILAGLGLDQVDPQMSVGLLSGGQKTRLSLALVLLSDPQLLLLDEPTNHLDIEMLEWLEDWLRNSPCGALIVSHDRTFLDHTVNRILEMDALKGSVREYSGNYSDYLEQRQVEIDKQWDAYNDQRLAVRRMKQDIARVKAQAAYTERQASSIRIGGPDMKIKGFKSYQQGIAKKVAKKAKSREKKLERYLEDDERVERPRQQWQMKFEFNDTPHLGRFVLQMKDLFVGYKPRSPILSELNLAVRAGRRIVITGPNGSGKTTLLRTLAGDLQPLAGELNIGPTVRLGMMHQEQAFSDLQRIALQEIMPSFSNQTEARSFLAAFQLNGDEPLKPIGMLSQGQQVRLLLASLVAQQCNLLLLDEPVNHLDISSRTQFEQALDQFDGAILVVIHDRYFIERFAEEIWWVDAGKIKVQIVR
jgi:ATP-binding cassette subfamily F protein 3